MNVWSWMTARAGGGAIDYHPIVVAISKDHPRPPSAKNDDLLASPLPFSSLRYAVTY